MPTVRTVLASVLLAAAWAKTPPGQAQGQHPHAGEVQLEQRQEPQEYWLAELGAKGKAPLAGDGYTLFRNIKDFGAKGDGQADDTESINKAIAYGDRCGQNCSSTFVKSAVVYFPPGKYKICSPIVQFYHTQFVGHPMDRPVIKGCKEFKGIALIDANPYMTGGVNWWVNQNQFFRQIRNFVLDMTEMPNDTRIQDDLAIVPTGIHWQVSQAATLQNILFKMPQRAEGVKHVGVIMENGSGGFVADLSFDGGDVGFRAGSQQYTARGLQFKGMRVAVDMLWDWGFNWQGISIEDTDLAFNVTSSMAGGAQGVGSVSFIDCRLKKVKVGIMTSADPATAANIVIDNMYTEGVNAVIKNTNGEVVLDARDQQIGPFTIGRRYLNGKGEYKTGYLADDGARKIPVRPNGLLKNYDFYTRSRPQYGTLKKEDVMRATDHGISNDGTGDQTEAINRYLEEAAKENKLAFFPAGIYQVQGTVHFPKGSRIQGSSWSQIQGTGGYFGDAEKPQVMVRVGNLDESGSMEISDMLFTVKGPTAGAILMEWNILADQQGSAAMWDSHFRVGGATGTDLDMAACPKGSQDFQKCMAGALLFHLKPRASGYFENVWLWTADHDNDANIFGQPTSSSTQINVYVGRGALIESKNPSWFYGGGSEHNTLYQYQLYKAENVFMGHIQTETPYFQPNPIATTPYKPGKFPGDPTFEDCREDDAQCKEAWGLRVIESANIYMHSVGVYQFFHDFSQDCIPGAACQRRLLEVKDSQDTIIYNLFSIGVPEVARAVGNGTIYRNETQRGFTTEVAVWIPPDGQEKPEIIFLSPDIYKPDANTASCDGVCQFVLPPSTLPRPTTITVPDYTTSIEISTETITITVPIEPITTDKIHFSNINVTSGQTPGRSFQPLPSIDLPQKTTVLTAKDGQVITRTLVLPPFPAITHGPPVEWGTKYPDVWSITGNRTRTRTSTDTGGPPLVLPPEPTYSHVWPKDWPWPGEIVFSDEEPEEDDDGGGGGGGGGGGKKSSCKAWFFSVCISFPKVNFNVKSIKFNFPPGPRLIGPGPPPGLTNLPEGFKFEGPPINFPKFSMLDGKPVYPTEPPEGCKTKEASICYYSTSYGVTEEPSTTRTTATSVASPECQTVWGCEVKDWETTDKETSTDQCERPTDAPRVPRRGLATQVEARATDSPVPRSGDGDDDSTSELGKRAITEQALNALYGCEQPGINHILYPADYFAADRIRAQLQNRRRANNRGFQEIGSDVGITRRGFTLFFHVDNVGLNVYRGLAEFLGPEIGEFSAYAQPENMAPTRRAAGQEEQDSVEVRNGNGTQPRSTGKRLGKREVGAVVDTFQDRALVSLPPGKDWEDDDYTEVGEDDEDLYMYWSEHDGSAAEGFSDQYVYLLESALPSDTHYVHQEFGPWIPGLDGKQRPRTALLDIPHTWGPAWQDSESLKLHSDRIISKVSGVNLGLVPQVNTILVAWHGIVDQSGQAYQPWERMLEGLLRIAEAVHLNNQQGKAVVNMSFTARGLSGRQIHALNWILARLSTRLNVVLVAAAGNYAEEPGRGRVDSYPALFGNPNDGNHIPGLIVVGATNEAGVRAAFSQDNPWITAYAYAERLNVVDFQLAQGYSEHAGATSFAAAIVSGLTSYYRAIDQRRHNQLRNPLNVKGLVQAFSTYKNPLGESDLVTNPDYRPIIWNGEIAYTPADGMDLDTKKKRQQNTAGDNKKQIKVASCLRDYDSWPSDAPPRDSVCPKLPDDLSQLDPKPFTPANNKIPVPRPVRFTTLEPGAPAGPTCTGGCEPGHTCSGYYCDPHPTKPPPDFSDPPFQPTKVTLTNLPTLPPDPPKETRPPRPPKQEKIVSLMQDNGIDGSGASYSLFAMAGDPCDHDPASVQGFGTWDQEMPPMLYEKFDAYGYKGIWYARPSSDLNDQRPGVLHVPGRWGEQDGPVQCVDDPERGKTHKCLLFVEYRRLLRCTWDD